MSRSIYLVNPAPDAPSYLDSEVFSAWGLKPAAFGADLTLPTLAAFVPEGWDVRLCDERLTPVHTRDLGYLSYRGRLLGGALRLRPRPDKYIASAPYAIATLSF